jgi:hypothetical protein
MTTAAETRLAYDRQDTIRDGVRWLQCLAAGRVSRRDPVKLFEERHPASFNLDLIRNPRTICQRPDPEPANSNIIRRDARNLHLIRRAAVSGGTTTGWGSPLVANHLLLIDFGLLIAAKDLLGQLAANGAHRLEPNTRVPAGDRGSVKARWVTEGGPTPFGPLDVDDGPTLRVGKLGRGAYLTQELALGTSDYATSYVEQWLSDIVVRATGQSLLDPALSEVPQQNPASLTFGAFTLPSSGATAADINADIAALFAHFEGAGTELKSPVLVTSRQIATAMAWLDTANGEPAFPGLSAVGGQVRGTPLLTSAEAGAQIVLLDANDVLFADGGVEVDVSMEATVQPTDTPVGGVDPPAGPTLTPLTLWTTNAIGVKVHRWCWWALARGSCARVDGVSLPMAAKARRAA